jgi:hypothetical protein
MKKQFVLYYIVTAMLFTFNSCKTENEPVIETQEVYLPMSVGNYWIYQHYKIDSLGNETPLRNAFDSLYIVKDSVINGERYYAFENSGYFGKLQGLFRDSCGYLIKSTGEIYFSATNFTDTIDYDYVYKKEYSPNRLLLYLLKTKMNPVKQTVSTPSGNYYTLMSNGFLTFYYYDELGNVTDTINASLNTYFAPNIGMVIDTYRYYLGAKQDKIKIERRLLRFKINE